MHATVRAAAVFLAALLVVSAAPASAEEYAPVQELSGQFQEGGPGEQGVAMVSATLADDVALPATVALPVPKGAQIYWSGEIVGTDPSKDPRVDYRLEPGEEYDLAVLTLSQARIGQVEYSVSPSFDGAVKTLSLYLPIPYTVGSAAVSMRTPADSQIASTSPGLTSAGSRGGWTYWSRSATNPEAGSVLEAAVSYSGGTFPAPAAGTGVGATAATGSDKTGGTILLLGVFAAIGALAVRAVMKKARYGAPESTQGQDGEEEVSEQGGDAGQADAEDDPFFGTG